MVAVKNWFFNPAPQEESPGTGIFVRNLGSTVEISDEEWQRDNPGREAVRFRPEADT